MHYHYNYYILHYIAEYIFELSLCGQPSQKINYCNDLHQRPHDEM